MLSIYGTFIQHCLLYTLIGICIIVTITVSIICIVYSTSKEKVYAHGESYKEDIYLI